MPVDKFFTVKEVVKRLRVSERSVMRYIKTKKLVALKIEQWRIKKNDLELLFKKHSNQK